MKPLIEFVNINKKFGDRTIYNPPLNFAINSGDKFGISGNSGAGKSTALNLIMGFVEPDEGEIYIDNNPNNPAIINNFRKKCFWIPQSFNFLKGIKVIEAIEKPFNFEINKSIKPDQNKILEFMEKVKLNSKLLESDINELSGGERQRICTVIAMLLDRDIIILDEPTSNLDMEISDGIIDMFFGSGKTIIISTHDKSIYDKCNIVIRL
ncbi:MAG: ATP-binding cassette domain-containing protein [Candidatus Kapabacteria bacterium]|nr:ATP-binding cassette domain-containing protein [Ignavibacteriota bacterium]MCW5884985.1 ATP-binding cassette domain-containing protein [Candidatus Kapabacteria bacterium]